MDNTNKYTRSNNLLGTDLGDQPQLLEDPFADFGVSLTNPNTEHSSNVILDTPLDSFMNGSNTVSTHQTFPSSQNTQQRSDQLWPIYDEKNLMGISYSQFSSDNTTPTNSTPPQTVSNNIRHVPQVQQVQQTQPISQVQQVQHVSQTTQVQPAQQVQQVHQLHQPKTHSHMPSQNTVSLGLYSQSNTLSATPLHNVYSPQTGPVSVSQQLQVLNNQPLLSPPLTRLQAESPSENYFNTPIPPHEAELMIIRQKYKAKSSIPTDVGSSHYGQQCISAAISSRLNPFQLHVGEHNLLKPYLTPLHVTTYLNIRNGILRLWLSNPKVNVTRSEAAGCAKDERFFNLAEVAYDWLVRNGYINFGCFEYPSFDFFNPISEEQRKPRKTVVIIGAGISGLSCARQLDNLFKRKARHFAEYQDPPRILLLEGRRRIGGRIYSAHLKSDPSHAVDVGAHVVPGYGNGNPLAVLIRRQLGLPVEKIHQEIHIHHGEEYISPEMQERVKKLFHHLLERVSQFRNKVLPPKTAKGDEVLIRVSKDPKEEFSEYHTIAKTEENGSISDNQIDESDYKSDSEWYSENPGKIEVQFLKDIGIQLRPGVAEDAVIHLAPEPQFEMYPSLGMSMDALLKQLQDISYITSKELRLLNWYYANLEQSSATCLDNLSLGNWNQHFPKAFTGSPSMVNNGYMSLARGLYTYEEKLDVRFKSCVSVVEYSGDHAEVFLENGEQIKADCVVATVPLGVLKDRQIQFIPDLPKWKSDSIERLGFGVTNKVCLIFDKEFWDKDKDIIAIAQPPEQNKNENDQESYKNTRGIFYSFHNATKVVGKPCLIGMISGSAALQVANETDEAIVDAAKSSLGKIYPDVMNVVLIESIVTRWQVDRLSRGAYSYLGLEATGADYDLLARPINDTLFFAGEATSRSHPATVHGAYLSGLRAANEVLTSLIGDIRIPQPLCPTLKDYLNFQQNPNSLSVYNSAIPTRNASMVGTPQPHQQLSQTHQTHQQNPSSAQPLQISAVLASSRYGTQPVSKSFNIPASISTPAEETPELKLKKLKELRQTEDNEKMRQDLIKALGQRPMKPERSGANPFLIFQKDFWEKCRLQCDAQKQKETGDPNAKAARNEVRAALGKMWRELPEAEKKPYLEMTKHIKETNNRKSELYREKMRRYDTEAEEFRKRWKEEHGSKPGEEESRLSKLINGESNKRRRT